MIYRLLAIVWLTLASTCPASSGSPQQLSDIQRLYELYYTGQFYSVLKETDTELKKLPDVQVTLKLLLLSADVNLELGQIELANKGLERASAIIGNQSGDPEVLGLFCLLQGKRLLLNGEPGPSKKWFGRALGHTGRGTGFCRRIRCLTLQQLGTLSYLQKDRAAAKYYHQQALAFADSNTLPERISMAVLLSSLALEEGYLNQPEKSSAYLKDAARLVRSAGKYEVLTIPYLQNLLDIYSGPMPEAVPFAGTASRFVQLVEKYYAPGHYLRYLVYYYHGRYWKNKGYLHKAKTYYRQAEWAVENFPQLLCFRKDVFYTLAAYDSHISADHKKGISYLRKAETNNTFSKTDKATFLCLLGSYYKRAGMADSSFYYLNMGLQASKSRGEKEDPDITMFAHLALYELYLGRKDPVSALKTLHESMAIAREKQVRKTAVANMWGKLGAYYMHFGQYDKALPCFHKGFEICDRHYSPRTAYDHPQQADPGFEEILIDLLHNHAFTLFKIYEENQTASYLKSAWDCHVVAARILEKAIMDTDFDQFESLWMNRANTTYNNGVSYSCQLFERTRDELFLDQAFTFAEKGKMLMLLAERHKQKTMRITGVPDSLIQVLADMRHEIMWLRDQIRLQAFQEEDIISFSGMEARLSKKLHEADILTVQLEHDYPEYYRHKNKLAVLDIRTARKFLSKDQVLLEFQLLRHNELIIIGLASDSAKIWRVPFGPELGNHLHLLKKILSNKPSDDPILGVRSFRESAEYLYDKLIRPASDFIGNRRLMIIPHNELSLIPFEILIDRNEPSGSDYSYHSLPYLFLKNPVSYAFSATLLFDNPPGLNKGRKVVYLVPEPGQDRLGNHALYVPEGIRREAEILKQMTGGHIYSGSKQARDLLQEYAGSIRVLHIAAHTIAIGDELAQPAIWLAGNPDDSTAVLLMPADLYGMPLNARLAVLSGCNTGYGRLKYGEGLLSLARSLSATGVQTIVYALWPVADRSAVAIMHGFYKQLLRGKNPDLALQVAKEKFLQSADPVTSHPFYWAEFVVSGYTRPVFTPFLRTWRVWIPACLITIIAAFLIIRRKIKTGSTGRSFWRAWHNTLTGRPNH